MLALAVTGCVLGAVVLLVLPAGLALAIRYRRVEHQPAFPPYRLSSSARRHADLRRSPADEETQELPTIQGGSHQ